MHVRKRPQPSRRRGILRALLVAVLLAIVVLAIILAVASLTAPPAKAPSVPSTPGPSTVRPAATNTPQISTPRPAPTATHTKKTALGPPPAAAAGIQLLDRTPAHNRFQAMGSPSADPGGGRLAYFRPARRAYVASPLLLSGRGGQPASAVGYGDALVRPAWSANGRYLLYVRVRPTRHFPGARWSLMQLDTARLRTVRLAVHDALNLLPLGWKGNRPLYLLANSTDSSLYTVSGGQPSQLAMVMPQVLTTAFLSPDGAHLGFAAPANCVYCTLDSFDLSTLVASIGPSGFSNESDLAWTADGKSMVTVLDHRLTVLDTDLRPVRSLPAPPGLPSVWPHRMRATVSPSQIRLVDSVTGQRFTASSGSP